MVDTRNPSRQLIPKAPTQYDPRDQEAMRAVLSRALDDLARPASPERYTVSATSPEARDATVLVDVASISDFLETLVTDLKAKGVIS